MLDWKQPGLLAAKIILAKAHEDIVNDKQVKEDEYLLKLIFKGA